MVNEVKAHLLIKKRCSTCPHFTTFGIKYCCDQKDPDFHVVAHSATAFLNFTTDMCGLLRKVE